MEEEEERKGSDFCPFMSMNFGMFRDGNEKRRIKDSPLFLFLIFLLLFFFPRVVMNLGELDREDQREEAAVLVTLLTV